MPLDATFYGGLEEAIAYFDTRLHEFAWSAASTKDRTNALIAATRLIDGLAFKGDKHTVWVIKQQSTEPTVAQTRAAEAAQVREFPRGADIVVPEDIRRASYEIAHSLLDDRDAELELEALMVTSVGYGAVRTSYDRSMIPTTHLVNLVPNALAWRLLSPYLRDPDAIKLSRVS